MPVFAQKQIPGLMPYPAKVEIREGKYRVRADFSIGLTCDPQDDILHAAANRVLLDMNRVSRSFFRQGFIKPGRTPQNPSVQVMATTRAEFSRGIDESYSLEVGSQGVGIRSKNTIGAVRALETLRQLMDRDSAGYFLPHARIEDAPRFTWRGLMIDVARHFIPLDVLKRNLDAMAAVKMNVLHLHLTDDEGFRIESKAYPKLHRQGSNGQYYTQDQMRDLIAYARLRGIMVVPEFDLPGHTRSWFAGHPELASAPGPYETGPRFDMGSNAGGSINIASLMTAPTPTMNPSRDEVYSFLDRLFAEMSALFPSPYFHIGADENNGVAWKNNPSIVAYMQKKGIADVHALQAHFVQRVHAIVKKHGKTMVGWEEVIHPGIPKDVVVQKWIPESGFMKGKGSPAELAAQGHAVLISQGFYTDVFMPAYIHYNNPAVTDDAPSGIWGGEAAQWTEVADGRNIERRIWPRAGAIAERLWSPASLKDSDAMYERLFRLERQLDEQGLQLSATTDRALRQMAVGGEAEDLRNLTDVLVPIRGYKMLFGKIANPVQLTNSLSPLNGVADVITTDPEVKRAFRKDVSLFLSSREKAAEQRIWERLKLWQGLHGRLTSACKTGCGYSGVMPHARQLGSLAEAGLEAMERISKGRSFTEDELKGLQSLLTESRKPREMTELDVVGEIESLIRQRLLPEPRQYPLF
jgi:hexosaminidase